MRIGREFDLDDVSHYDQGEPIPMDASRIGALTVQVFGNIEGWIASRWQERGGLAAYAEHAGAVGLEPLRLQQSGLNLAMPAGLEGTGITFIIMGLMAMSFMGLAGIYAG